MNRGEIAAQGYEIKISLYTIKHNADYRLSVDILFNQRFKVGYRFMIYI